MESENAFRTQFNNWTQRNNPSNAPSLPAFSEWTDYIKNGANDLYTSLPTYRNENQIQEPSWFQLSNFEKIVGFIMCLSGSALCFGISFFLFPVLALKPRKFGMLWSLGSLLFVISFGILQGPKKYFYHLISKDRIVFSAVFFGSVLATLYASIVMKSTIFTIITGVIEIFAVLYYTISYFPFGAQTLTFFTSYMVGWVGGFIGGIL
ncbi:protein transport protein Sft2p [[Candida] jaroonii]|uniref:Protein transport protein Sft2p n=1 Tax=[Candida] jaroonii TaxID=467808 RepID=A0ACA9Y6B9_9ASCO|nr:protein transport protein Sft2p [[Candida] jaroonii]